PVLTLPRHCELTEAVQVGYGPFEGYGFHALESLQCMVERRRGGESGVRAVQCLQGEEMWRAVDRGVVSRTLLESALARGAGHAPYPVERTLLTTGVLDAVMISRSDKNRRVETPYLDIRYQATDWPFAQDPVPKPIKR